MPVHWHAVTDGRGEKFLAVLTGRSFVGENQESASDAASCSESNRLECVAGRTTRPNIEGQVEWEMSFCHKKSSQQVALGLCERARRGPVSSPLRGLGAPPGRVRVAGRELGAPAGRVARRRRGHYVGEEAGRKV